MATTAQASLCALIRRPPFDVCWGFRTRRIVTAVLQHCYSGGKFVPHIHQLIGAAHISGTLAGAGYRSVTAA